MAPTAETRLMRVNWWALCFAVWTALFVGITIAVTIPDYPKTGSFWYNLMKDPTCYWHEEWVVIGTWLAGCFLMALALMCSVVREVLEAMLNIFGRGP